ncbi:DUF5343 domain-containing protein [Paraburkholderia bannensis]|uniref:DUF5343 domain-containing protein n=1 Tax=Paraburkholderia bannensis TaxID=765414 RepID=UPI002ABD8B8B|nr:DUF5343 domain-containing protein [Paraburkholderia bannensis]
MPASLTYLASNKNLETLFTTIQSAKVPDRFTQDFLSTTIGLKGTNDRMMIPLLRTLGFLEASGAPTARYRELKNQDNAKRAIANGIRGAYAPLFEANEAANSLSADKLRGLVAQVAGTDNSMTARIVATFSALCRLGDFSASNTGNASEVEDEEEKDERNADPTDRKLHGLPPKLSTQFHYNIQVHLPSNGTEEVYLNIFNALRKVFQ